MKTHIECPCCMNEVTAWIDPGEEPVYYPNDRAHPGAPTTLEDIEGCECWETLQHFRHEREGSGDGWYIDRVLSRIRERAI